MTARSMHSRLLVQVIGFALLIPALVLFPPVAMCLFLANRLRAARLRSEFHRAWPGRCIVFVYSESPNWKEYIERRILPGYSGKAVTVNWSRRSEWKKPKPLEVRIFEHWSGAREFNPMAIVIPSHGKVRTIRFFKAFRDATHGRMQALEQSESELREAVAEANGAA